LSEKEKRKWWHPDPGYHGEKKTEEKLPNEVKEWGEKQGYQVKEEKPKRKWWQPDPGYYREKARNGARKVVKVAKTVDKGYRKSRKKMRKLERDIPSQRLGTLIGGYQQRVARNVESASPFTRALFSGFLPSKPKKRKGVRTVVNVYVGGAKVERRKKKQRSKDPFGIGKFF